MNVILFPSSAWVSSEKSSGNQVVITDSSVIRHIQIVLGAGVGDTLKVGEIGGQLGVAKIVDMCDDGVVLAEVRLDTPPSPKLDLTLILALPRPKVLRRLIMDMTAMGVNHIILLNSARTDKSYWGSPLLARMDEYLLEGLQQGVDTVMPKVTIAKRFKPFVQDELPSIIGENTAIVAHPYADASFGQACQDGLPKVLIVGAEGGFVPYEIELLASVGARAASLGSRILRTESAVNALLGRWLD
ncbi:16S rRNA (uracil(1498)-N(3))-methyltransferase [Moraxella sp. FZLJ2107]|uniref:16S rRNA (uracil(1498)-N(3))-methyltransferase n=1 Tax=unclassified Moraxella TaxID=2685852 RepID=UPI0020C92AF8|nr:MULTISPECIES: 16S rRNA (uracil(1498)-N(3))-methyltransferase [unclassified Moraxella]UTO05961.1 16S rRNA (uracil(1498)-N(3))-methyltransferase [Moraxella sp. FZLJ2107]UTO22697.1 16S rRNA (uracil(1498)-N(3))-methyltransferase [Moraxella sp. FZLJ2109]